MICADIHYKIKNPSQMSPMNVREQVHQEIKKFKKLFQVGCGSGSISIDFLLNGGSQASLLDRDYDTCLVSKNNLNYNNVTADIYNLVVEEYVKFIHDTFDAIVVTTAWIKSTEMISLIDQCLEVNGVIIMVIREDVANTNSLSCVKEMIKRCDVSVLTPIISATDNMTRLIFKGIKK
jgi:precorrin-6B methylase 2